MYFTMGGFSLAVFLSIVTTISCVDDESGRNSSYVKARKHNPMDVVLEWKQITYEYPSLEEEKSDIKKANYIPGNPFPSDVDVSYFSGVRKIFVVTPRTLQGVPVSLSTVSAKVSHGGPVLVPYPSWSWHKTSQKCSTRLVSVINIKIDRCGRLWVLDAGLIAGNLTCPPKVLAFSLKTDKVVYQYELPEENFFDVSFFVDIVVDIRDKCESPYVYLADAGANTIVVWNVKTNSSWTIQDKMMYPSADYATISLNGHTYDTMIGIVTISITPYTPGSKEDREIYFHPLNSGTETVVSTKFLQNPALFEEKKCAPEAMRYPEQFYTFPRRRPTQSLYEDIDKDGVLLFGLIEQSALACYNTNDRRTHYEIILTDTYLLDFIFDVKVIDKQRGRDQELWVISNRYENIATCSLNLHEVNFRILVGNVAELIAGKQCQPRTGRN